MPGSIQISVLEFNGLPLQLSPSLLKVSLGKREYQTSDFNEFSFPLTTLRDDLIVAVYDAEGNELAHLGIRTLSIVEKVHWDDIFPLEGGGYLHLKLKFMLSQQEQTRIRAMREAALKEKQVSGASALSARVTNLVDAASPSSSHSELPLSDPQKSSVLEVKKLEDSVQAGLFSNPGIPRGIQEPGFADEERIIPKDNDTREKAGSDPSGQEAEARPAKKIDTQSSIHRTPQKSGSSDKASAKKESPISIVASSSDSLNLNSVSKVKIIANAFETGVAKQDVEYTLNPAVVKVVGKKFLKGGNPKEFEPTNSVEEHNRSSRLVAVGSKLDTVRGVNNAISAESNVDDVEPQARMETANSDTLSTSETVTTPGTDQSLFIVTDPMVDGMNMNTEETGISTAYSDSDRSLTSETTGTPGKKLEYNFNFEDGLSPKEIRRKDPYATKFNPSNDESIPLEFIEEGNICFDKSEAKPYHDEVTTNIHGDSIEHETDEKNDKDSEESVDTKESKPESPSNDAWNGLVAQAVKIALIVGFGVLVFLTRNKEPRKTSKTEPGPSLFRPSEYMNDPVLEAEDWIDS